MFATLKTYGRAVVAAVLGVLTIAVTVLAKRLGTVKEERDAARKHAEHATEVITHDVEVSEQADARLVEVRRELEEGKNPSELIDPNEDWQI